MNVQIITVQIPFNISSQMQKYSSYTDNHVTAVSSCRVNEALVFSV